MTRLGVCAAVFGDRPIEELPALLSGVGARVVDLPTDSTLRCTPTLAQLTDSGWARRFAGLLSARGIEVGCVSNSRDTQLFLGPHGPHTDPVAPGGPEDKRRHAATYADATIGFAAVIGAPDVRLYYGCGDYALWLDWRGSGRDRADNVQALVDDLRPHLRRCADLGLRVLVEPHPRQAVYDPPTVRLLLELLDGTGEADNFGLCVDVANMAALGWDPVPLVRGWGTRLAAVHVKDLQRATGEVTAPAAGWSRYGPGPPIRFRALGAGALPWAEVVTALVEQDFTGTLYVEHEDVLLPREQGVTAALRTLAELVPCRPADGRTW